jgi:hypothetical protein
VRRGKCSDCDSEACVTEGRCREIVNCFTFHDQLMNWKISKPSCQ